MDYIVKCNDVLKSNLLFNKFLFTVNASEVDRIGVNKTVYMSNGDKYFFVTVKSYDRFSQGRRCPTIGEAQFEIMLDLYQKQKAEAERSDVSFDGINQRVLLDDSQRKSENEYNT